MIDRRSFLARVAAIPAAVAAVTKAAPELADVLRSPYPSDAALAAIHDDSLDAAAPAVTYVEWLKESAMVECSMPKAHAIITDLADPELD